MSKRDFDTWLSTFRPSINRYDYYVDFQKVYENANALKIEISILNSLIGSKNIEKDFEQLIKKYPECLKAIPTLLAVRSNEIYCRDDNGEFNYKFDAVTQSVDEYKYFMREVGLFDMLSNHLINNLYDYVTGIEVGLDSNGRKNRGGHQMEDLVEYFLKKTGKEYYPQLRLANIEKKWGVDLSRISADGTSTKIWDFVVKTPNNIYVIETNFYGGAGSKLNETARSYKMIAEESKGIPNFYFVWITDGRGWVSTRRNLKETFDVLENLYNIADMENGILNTLLK